MISHDQSVMTTYNSINNNNSINDNNGYRLLPIDTVNDSFFWVVIITTFVHDSMPTTNSKETNIQYLLDNREFSL